MRAVILLCWVISGTAETVLQPSLNVLALQNESMEVASWAGWSHHYSMEKVEKSTEKPGLQVNVTKSEEQETLHSERLVEKEHETSDEEDRKVSSRGHEKDQKERLKPNAEDVASHAFEDVEKFQHLYAEAGNVDPSAAPARVHQILNQHNTSLATPSPSQYVHPSVLPLVSTVTSPPAFPLLSGGTTQEASSLLLTEGRRLLATNMSAMLSNGRIANLLVAETEKGNSMLHLGMKLEVTSTAMAARASPTAISLPNTSRPKPQPETAIKANRVATTKKNKLLKKLKAKEKKTKALKKGEKVKKLEKDEMTTVPPFPYFKDDYCPRECACYGRVVQCSDKKLEKVPYGIPYNSRYVLLMNNHIGSIPLNLLSEYLFMDFLVLSNNRLTDNSVEGAFKGIQALKRLYLERNSLQSIPADLPASLEELRLDGNKVRVMSETAWNRCPGLQVLSLNNNSLGSGSSLLPAGVLSPLTSLRTLSLSHNRLTSVPLLLPLSLQELYLRGNLIQRFQGGVLLGKAGLQVLDLSANRLTNKGLGKAALINATSLESLNLEGNFLKHVPRHLPHSLKTLNLEGNSISSVSKSTFLSLPNLEHLGLGHNKIFKVVPGAFQVLPQLHQLDLSHNALRQVPRHLPSWLVSISLAHNKIQTIPRDAFCWERHEETPSSRLLRVQLENNLLDLGRLDSLALSCLRGFQVVHFH